jgi:hypothetical protein
MTESYHLPPETPQRHPWQALAELAERLEKENAELRAQLELARAVSPLPGMDKSQLGVQT